MGTFASRPLPMESMPGYLMLLSLASESNDIVVQVFEYHFGSTFEIVEGLKVSIHDSI
jgi:hypothetical protein